MNTRSELAANLTKTLHIAIMIFIIVGWAIPSKPITYLHLALIPLVILHWKTNDDVCILTELELKLRGVVCDLDEMRGRFIAGLIEQCFGWSPPDRLLKIVTYSVMLVSWLVSLLTVA